MNTPTKRTRKLAILILIAGALLLFTYAEKRTTTEASLLLLNNVEALTIVEGYDSECHLDGGLCFFEGSRGIGTNIAED